MEIALPRRMTVVTMTERNWAIGGCRWVIMAHAVK